MEETSKCANLEGLFFSKMDGLAMLDQFVVSLQPHKDSSIKYQEGK